MIIWKKKLGHKLSKIDINILPATLKLEYTAVERNPRWVATSSSESRLLPPQRVESFCECRDGSEENVELDVATNHRMEGLSNWCSPYDVYISISCVHCSALSGSL